MTNSARVKCGREDDTKQVIWELHMSGGKRCSGEGKRKVDTSHKQVPLMNAFCQKEVM